MPIKSLAFGKIFRKINKQNRYSDICWHIPCTLLIIALFESVLKVVNLWPLTCVRGHTTLASCGLILLQIVLIQRGFSFPF